MTGHATRRWLVGPLALTACWLGGCGSRTPIKTPAQVSPKTVDGFTERVAEALCQYITRCQGELGASDASLASCLDDARQQLSTDFRVDPAFYAVDIRAAQACFDDFANLGCHDNRNYAVQQCSQAFTGKLGSGACCDSRGGCGPGLFCNFSGPSGTCQPVRTQGQSCSSDDECAVDLYCDGSHCQPILGTGQTCGGLSQRQCGPLYCLASCQQAPGPGDDCGSTLPCWGGYLTCLSGSGSQGQCAVDASLNAPCSDTGSGAPQCQPDLWCDNGSCQPLPGLGKECSLDGGCNSDQLYCAQDPSSSTGRRCANRLPAGTDCNPGLIGNLNSCAKSYTCDVTSHKCVPAAPAICP